MEDLDIAAVTKRSIHGVFALVTRTFFIQIITVAVNFLLTIYLSASVFGVYFIVTSIISFLTYFSDIGLAAALIQKKESVTDEDLRTTFTIQQALVISVVVLALFASPLVGHFYKLEPEGIFLFQALVIAFFLSSLKTIPSILLERNLRFEKLVIPEIVETIVFNGVALVLAIKGFGISSFTYAVLARGVSGMVAIYIVSPWKIGFGFSKQEAKKLLSFGIPFQLNSFLALLKDDVMVAYIGKVLPLAQVGYIGFAQKWSLAPLQLIMDNIIRVTFPSYARLQHDKDNLVKAVEKSLFVLTLVIFPCLVGLVTLVPVFMELVPKYQHKWDLALISLGFFSINAALSTISTPLTNALNAIGKIKMTLYLMILWTVLTWVLSPLFIYLFGFNGFALASALISCTVVLVIWLTRKYIPFSVVHIWIPAISAILMGVILIGLIHLLPKTFLSLVLLIGIGGFAYLGMTILLAREEVIKDIALVKEQFIH